MLSAVNGVLYSVQATTMRSTRQRPPERSAAPEHPAHTEDPMPDRGSWTGVCPTCDERITTRRSVAAVLPIWLTCTNCGGRLAGDRYVQAITVAKSIVVIGSIVAALWMTHSVEISRSMPLADRAEDLALRVKYLIGIVGLIALVFFAWRAEGSLIRRYGHYVATAAQPRALGFLRRYLLASGAALVLLLTWLYAYVNPPAAALLMVLAVASIMLLYPRYDIRVGYLTGKTLGLALVATAGVFNVAALIVGTLAFANYPEEPPFQKELAVSSGQPGQQGTWIELKGLLETYEMISSPPPIAGPPRGATGVEGGFGAEAAAAADAGMGASQQRDVILDFLAQQVVSLPDDALAAGQLPRLFAVWPIANQEAQEIETLLRLRQGSRAREKYLRLWRVADNLASGSPVLAQHVVAVEITSRLVGLYLAGENRRTLSSEEEMLQLSGGLESKLDRSFSIAVANEYRSTSLWTRQLIAGVAPVDCNALPTLLCVVPWPWPFFDVNKTLRAEYETFSRLIAMSGRPFYSLEGEIAAFGDELGANTGVSVLRNPVGSAAFAMLAPAGLEEFIYPKERAIASLTILRYVIQSSLNGEFENVPIDRLTGSPFALSRAGRSVVISSADERTGEPAIRYVVRTDV